jgi:hypothetical protein
MTVLIMLVGERKLNSPLEVPNPSGMSMNMLMAPQPEPQVMSTARKMTASRIGRWVCRAVISQPPRRRAFLN